jgi:general secretion pathway protein K
MSARRGGFVLIAALWLLVALGAVGLDAALRSRTRRLAAANLVDQTRARAAALAGTEYARSRLTAAMLDRADELRAQALERARTDRQRTSASRQSVQSLFRQADPYEDPWRDPDLLVVPEMAFGDARFSLRLRDTGAALNVNEASAAMLRNFFAQGMRVDYADADRLAQAIADWRDEDDIPRVNGGEREQYLDERMPVLPANRPFAELSELRYVMGMTRELYEAARPYLTLIGSGDINVNAAPEPVLLALPGVTESVANQLIRLRESGSVPRSARELQAMLPSAMAALLERADDDFDDNVTFATNEVEIASDGRVEGGPVRVRARVVVARSNTGAVVVWRKIE